MHLIVRFLGNSRSLALPIFHAITGCDTVSWFHGRGKQTAWNVWDTTSFLKIKDDSWENIESSQNFKTIQKFVGMLYDCKYSESTHATVSCTYFIQFYVRVSHECNFFCFCFS